MRYFLIAIVAFAGYQFALPTTEHPALLLISSLQDEQREEALFNFEDQLRKDWHYLPAASYGRPGIKMSSLDDLQRSYVHDLLNTVLSKKGYAKTKAIIDLENILAKIEDNYRSRDPEQYAIAIFGLPSTKEPWAWSFSGHHISYHFTYVEGEVSTTPRFLGANPGKVMSGKNQGLRVLGREEDLGFELLLSLSEEQAQKAVIAGEAYWEILTTNKIKVDPLEERGIRQSELSAEQNGILQSLLNEYLSTLSEELAMSRKARLPAEDLLFAWAGSKELGQAHYYRIQGTSFLIEFDNAQNGANHVHTVWREFDGDFGEDLILAHRNKHKH